MVIVYVWSGIFSGILKIFPNKWDCLHDVKLNILELIHYVSVGFMLIILIAVDNRSTKAVLLLAEFTTYVSWFKFLLILTPFDRVNYLKYINCNDHLFSFYLFVWLLQVGRYAVMLLIVLRETFRLHLIFLIIVMMVTLPVIIPQNYNQLSSVHDIIELIEKRFTIPMIICIYCPLFTDYFTIYM